GVCEACRNSSLCKSDRQSDFPERNTPLDNPSARGSTRGMVQKRELGAPVGPSVAADPAAVRLLYQYVASGTVWLLVGTAAGLIASLKLNWPDVLAVPWLSFGRLRAIHTNVVFWGWSTPAMAGLALYVVSRTSRAPLWHPELSRIALWLWNAVALG